MSAKKITLCNQKGGVGKTTVSMLLAMTLADVGKRVGVIDLDAQETATKWIQNLGSERLEVVTEGGEYDVIFYDTPPNLGESLRVAVSESDTIVVVSSPSPADLWSTKETLAFLDEHAPDAERRFLFNMVERGRKLSEERENLADVIGVKPMKSALPRYSAYQHAVFSGLSSLAPKDYKAVSDVALELLS